MSISSLASRVAATHPGLGPGQFVSMTTRTALENLARDCGLAPFVERANDADLISIYQVALKDAEAAKRVAQRIRMRFDDTLLSAPEPPKAPSAPKAPEPPAGPSLDAVRQMVKDEVREGVLSPLQEMLGRMDKGLRSDFAGLLSSNRDVILDDVRASMAGIAAEALRNLTPTRLDVTTPKNPEVKSLGLVHRKTPQLINALAAGVNVYLHGPAGSGKTTGAHKAAEALGVQFYFAAKVESEYQLMGFKDARGETVRTQFREAYEHGGTFLFDEMDASSPSAVVALNAALANGVCPFPDKIVERHADFYCIGAGNTKLTGANRQYAGRNQLDAASIDRFAFMEWTYDDDLERALSQDARWVVYVQKARQAVADRGLTHLVTPRATYDGCKLLAAGFDWDTVADMVVYKGLDADTRRQIEQAL